MMLEWVSRMVLMPMPRVVLISAWAESRLTPSAMVTLTCLSSTRRMASLLTMLLISSSSSSPFSGLPRQAPRAAAYFRPTRWKPGMPTLMPFL